MGWHLAVDHTGHIHTPNRQRAMAHSRSVRQKTCTDKATKPNLSHISPHTAQNEETYHCFCLCWFNQVEEMLLTLVRLCALVAMNIILSENMLWKIINSED